MEVVTSTFHRRPLPAPAVEFASSEGQQLFGEALQAGSMGSFFRLIEQFHTQVEPAFCGLGSVVMALNALNVDPKKTWKGPWRWFCESMLECCVPLDKIKQEGITFGQLACLARCQGAFVEARRADEPSCSENAFRAAVCRASCQRVLSTSEETNGSSLCVLLVGYRRSSLNQSGDGHWSPIGGYHSESDRVLILDTARFKYPPHWVPLQDLWAAMQPVDPATQRSRGYLVLSARPEWSQCLSLELLSSPPTSPSFEETLGAATGDDPAEVMRQAVDFLDDSSRCIRVALKAAASQEPDDTGREAVLAALRRAAANVDASLGAACVVVNGNDADLVGTDDGGLRDVERRMAQLLSVDFATWERAICPEATELLALPPSGRKQRTEFSGRRSWAVLRPLLEVDALDPVLHAEVRALRAQRTDILTSASNPCCDRR